MASLQLAHRLFHPQIPDTPFTTAGQLSKSENTAFVLLDNRDTQLSLLGVDLADQNTLYQLALIPLDGNGERASVATVKACHLPFSTSAALTVHLDSSDYPYALSYYVDGTPSSGACPSRKALKAIGSDSLNMPANTTLHIARPSHPPLPELRSPPPLAADGNPVVPPREKGFVEKYWLYIILAVLALVVVSGPPEEEGQGAPAPARGR